MVSMKKKLLYILLSLTALFIAIIITLPHVVQSERIQQEIVQRVNECYVVDAEVSEVKLSFFPIPHIDLLDVEVQHSAFQVLIPEVKAYPSWRIILGRTEVGRINLINPQFTLHTDPFKDISASAKPTFILPANLPGVSVLIQNGLIQLPELLTDLGVLRPTTFSDINAKLVIKKGLISLNWQSNSNFCNNFVVKGSFSIKELMSKGKIHLNHLDLAKAFKSSTLGPLAFITDTSSFSSAFTYEPAHGLSLQFDGDIPDFTLTGPDLGDKPPVPIRIREGHVVLTVADDLLELDIESLDIIKPQLKLQGLCRYYRPEGAGEKHVKLDLKGTDIDVTSIRQPLLDLVGTNIVAQTVVDIVKSGYANSASYYFDAPLSGFEDINTMLIEVDVERADIHLKDVPLDLTNAKGKIKIKDGDLTGWGITTNVQDTYGSQGSFLVGLAHDKWGLNVDVNIDANLAELPPFLRTVIPDQTVTRELLELSATGRGKAHLTIADDLRDFDVLVKVLHFTNPDIRYGRLSWPISPTSGTLQVTTNGAQWQNLSLKMGNHIIEETTGSIDWSQPKTPFELTSISGIFDTNTILAELREHEELQTTLDAVVTTIVGSSQIVGTLKGDFFDPAGYTYNFDTLLKDLSVWSPHLPEQLTVDGAQVKITDHSIDIQKTTGLALGESLQMGGTLTHRKWQEWTGNLVFTGELDQSIMDWVRREQLIPEKLQLNLPTALEDLRVKWDQAELYIEGGVRPIDTDSSLQLKVTKNAEITAGEFNIFHGKDTTQIRFFIEPAKDQYDFFLNGNLSGKALTDLLDDPFVEFDTISGTMNIHIGFPHNETPPSMIFSGNLTLTDLYFLIDNKRSRDHTISLEIDGKNNVLNVKKLAIDYSKDSLFSSGKFIHEGWTGHLTMDLRSPTINTDTVDEIIISLDTFLYKRLGLEKRTSQNPSKYNLFSQFNFKFDEFTIPFGEKNKDADNGKGSKTYQFPVTPLIGRYSFNNTNSSLQVEDSMVCGLELEAFLTWYGDTETSKTVSVQTPKDTTVELRDFLECFNSNAVIDGPMTFKAKGASKKGKVTKAQFVLKSEEGFIYKFVAVAKAISILNIKGWSGSIWKEGYYYNQLELSGTIDNNILTISKMFIDGDGVDIVGKGTFDLDKMEYDMVFYVVPFSSISHFVTNVPIFGRLIGGKEGRIISVPVKITGSAINPDVSIMDAGAIGKATGEWIWDTVTIPFSWQSERSSDTDLLDLEEEDEHVPLPQEN